MFLSDKQFKQFMANVNKAVLTLTEHIAQIEEHLKSTGYEFKRSEDEKENDKEAC